MPGRHVRAGRLRRRLAVAFVLVAGISAGALALASYLLVRQARLADSLDRAKAEVRYDLVLAQSSFPSLDQQAVPDLLSAFEQRVHVVLVAQGVRTPSNTSFDPPISPDLRSLVLAGQLGYQRLTSRGAITCSSSVDASPAPPPTSSTSCSSRTASPETSPSSAPRC
jgi:two-component system sensor histidine kinase MtrB